MSRVVVIGGGAAGMMAAVSAAGNGCRVTLAEKNEKLGKKLYITGKGRCNLTNACEPGEFLSYVERNPKFLYSAFGRFDNEAAMEFFEKAGCRLKTERGERVFPVSDHASDVISALTRRLKELGVDVRLRTEVRGIRTDGRNVTGVSLSGGEEIDAEAVVVCTGGLSYPSTGSTGDGYRMAEECGHSITRLLPSLVGLYIGGSWCGRLEGLSLKNVEIRLEKGGVKLYEGFGEMVFTRGGVSGPLILAASSRYQEAVGFHSGGGKKGKTSGGGAGEETTLILDLKPALSAEQLDRRLLRDFDGQKNKQFKNALGGLFPAKLIPVMIECSGIPPEKKVNEITKGERQAFAGLIKEFRMTVTGTGGFDEAVITKGGVAVEEINPSTMESRLVKGLYFAGEVLDLDGVTGGFNLQIAWSTGALAGRAAGSGGGNGISIAGGEKTEMGFCVAIDGPAGAGKSTIAKKVAKRLGFLYVDTGAMYRAIALFLLRRGIDPEDAERVGRELQEADITIRYENGEQVVLLNGENVNGLIRSEEVGNMASRSSAGREVRQKLLELQRSLAGSADVVMDGRDIGTCVLPDAQVKVYLTASAEVRAERRYRELAARGEDCAPEKIREDIVRRDEQDMNREISPLRRADDAVLVDSSEMTIDQVTEAIVELCGEKGKE